MNKYPFLVYSGSDIQGLNYNLNSAGIYLLKVNNRNTRTWCQICLRLTIKTIVNLENISHLVLVFLLLTLNIIAGWEGNQYEQNGFP